jgi:hypothetical protein
MRHSVRSRCIAGSPTSPTSADYFTAWSAKALALGEEPE